MNEMQVFKYEDNEVRTVEQSGEVWWVLADVCRVLELSNPSKVAARLDSDEKQSLKFDPNSELGLGHNGATIINESGLYKVILRSDKPEAKKFTRWVTHEVLPTIRKTGGYGNQAAMMDKVLDKLVQVTANLTQAVTILATVMGQPNSKVSTPHPKAGPFIPANSLKLETFPPEIVEQVDGMLEDMVRQQALNFSMIARFYTMNGYTISSPSVKRYFDRHFSQN